MTSHPLRIPPQASLINIVSKRATENERKEMIYTTCAEPRSKMFPAKIPLTRFSMRFPSSSIASLKRTTSGNSVIALAFSSSYRTHHESISQEKTCFSNKKPLSRKPNLNFLEYVSKPQLSEYQLTDST